MRAAIISDIHGNRVALETVLQDCERQKVDVIACLGDVAAIGPDPGGCIDLLARNEIVTIQGNVDAWLTDPDHTGSSDPLLREMTAWTQTQLSAEQLIWLSDLAPGAIGELFPGRKQVLSHGSPRSCDDVVAPNTPDAQLEQMYGAHKSEPGLDLAFGGHTHIPMLRRWGEVTLINPGSVGLPGVGPGAPGLAVNVAPTWGEYAILESDVAGQQFEVRFRRIALPMDKMLLAASHMHGFDWWRSRWG
jgi:predicted phosphodiesterase